MADATPASDNSAPVVHSGFFLPLAIYILEGIAVAFVVFVVASFLGAIAAGAANSWITAQQAIYMAQAIAVLAFAGVALYQFRRYIKLP